MGTLKKDRTTSERDLAKVTRQIDKVIDAITEGMFHSSMKAKMSKHKTRKAKLETDVQSSDNTPPFLLHPACLIVIVRKWRTSLMR
ncbi:MAG: hypothetical protein HRU33_14555 [Rhodobacteraceae bacterium]|nr:hypothetical protein [Paracoccaceae bacterium]